MAKSSMPKRAGFFRFWIYSFGYSFSIGGGIVAVSSGFLGTLVTLASKYVPSFAKAEWSVWIETYHREVIVAAAILGGLLYGPFAMYRKLWGECENKVKDSDADASTAETENKELRREKRELLAKGLSDDEKRAEEVAREYYRVWKQTQEQTDPGYLLKLLIEAGVLFLKDQPNALDQVLGAIDNTAAPNPLANYWDKNHIWDFAKWAKETMYDQDMRVLDLLPRGRWIGQWSYSPYADLWFPVIGKPNPSSSVVTIQESAHPSSAAESSSPAAEPPLE